MSKKEYDMNEKSSKEIKKHRSLGGVPYIYIYVYTHKGYLGLIWGNYTPETSSVICSYSEFLFPTLPWWKRVSS